MGYSRSHRSKASRAGSDEILFRIIGGARRVEISTRQVFRIAGRNCSGTQPIVYACQEHRERTATGLSC